MFSFGMILRAKGCFACEVVAFPPPPPQIQHAEQASQLVHVLLFLQELLLTQSFIYPKNLQAHMS